MWLCTPVREVRFWIDRRRPLKNRSGQPRKPIRRSGRPGPGQRQSALVTEFRTSIDFGVSLSGPLGRAGRVAALLSS